MIIVKAEKSEDNFFHFELEEHHRETDEKTVVTLKIRKTIEPGDKVLSQSIDSTDLKKYIEATARTRTVYIPKKVERELFYRCADFIAKAQELPMNVKNVIYPGSSLILLEYGTLGLRDSEVEVFFREVMSGIMERNVVLEKVEVEEEPASIEDALGWKEDNTFEPFPFGGEKGGFVDDDEDFEIGEVAEDD